MGSIIFTNKGEEFGYLSNFYCSEFTINTIKFNSMVQYLVYSKAKLYNDLIISLYALDTSNLEDLMNLGRQIKSDNNVLWNSVKQLYLYNGLYEKFSQNDKILYELLETDGHSLIYSSDDCYYGTGVSVNLSKNMVKWKGLNILGGTLVFVRDELRKQIEEV